MMNNVARLLILIFIVALTHLSVIRLADATDCVADNATTFEQRLQWALYKIDYNDDPYDTSSSKCQEGERSLIVVQGTIELSYDIFLNSAWGVHLQGIEDAKIILTSPAAFSGKNPGQCAIVLATNKHWIENITIENSNGPGICITGDNNIVKGNTVLPAYSGIEIGGSSNTVHGNTITDAYGAGISINKNGHIITNNKVTNAGSFGFAYAAANITCVHNRDGNSVVTADGPGFNACTPVAVVDPAPKPEPSPEPKPEPTPKKDDGPKCSANQYLFGGTLCCDLTTEVPDPLSQTCKKKVLTAPTPPPAPAIIPPVGEESGQAANGESNCALRPGSDSTPRISFGSAWLIVLGALLLVIIRSQADHHHNHRGRP